MFSIYTVGSLFRNYVACKRFLSVRYDWHIGKIMKTPLFTHILINFTFKVLLVAKQISTQDLFS